MQENQDSQQLLNFRHQFAEYFLFKIWEKYVKGFAKMVGKHIANEVVWLLEQKRDDHEDNIEEAEETPQEPAPSIPTDPSLTYTHYKANTTLKGRIISWKFKKELQPFAIKRTDGIQYFRKKVKVFGSLPRCELNHLDQIDLINPDGDKDAQKIEKLVKRQLRRGGGLFFTPTMGNRKIVTDPQTGKNRIKVSYPAARCLKSVPLMKIPQDFLKDMSTWFYNGKTGEAEFMDQSYHIFFRLYDPVNLINFSKKDLRKLSRVSIDCHKDDREEAMKFRNQVYKLISSGAHSEDHRPMKEDLINPG